MSLLGMENFAYGDVAATFTTGQTTLSMFTGHTARFTTFPCMAVLFNQSDHDTPHEAFYEPATPDAEIIEITSKAGDTFDVIKRGQDGTSAIATTPGKTYRVAVIATRSQWLKVCRAPPDGSDSFDAILSGTASSVTAALARFVNAVGGADSAVSIQGGATDGDLIDLMMGNSAAGVDMVDLKLTYAAALSKLQLLFNSISFLYAEDNGALAFHKTSATEIAPSVQFGERVGFDSFFSGAITAAAIVAGVATVTSNFVRFTSETGTTDDLDTINATIMSGTRVMILVEKSGAHNITLKDGTGNLSMLSGDYIIDTTSKRSMLVSVGNPITSWLEILRV